MMLAAWRHDKMNVSDDVGISTRAVSQLASRLDH